jgi:two-component system, NtrC family, C4-dicarboxylate transport response regulator DctD
VNKQKPPGTVFLFEDDATLRHAIVQSLEIEGFSVSAHESVEDCTAKFGPELDAVVVTDIRLPGADGRQLFRRLVAIDPDLPVVFITGHGELQEAVDLMREGAYDFISKPYSPPRLLTSVRNALEHRRLVLVNRRIRSSVRDDGIPLPLRGESEQIAQLRTSVRGLANTDVSVLIIGETGTGKESVAAALHKLSHRGSKPLSIVDCASLPESLVEVELFGIEETVSGMRRHKPGRITLADRGTLFLDSVDTLPLNAQSRLLRAVEEKQVTAVGATTSRDISCRVISAATQDIGRMCKEGRFRSDLYFRLNTVTLNLPPLRERREDIATLFIELLAGSANRLKRAPPALTKGVRTTLIEHSWPGNIRELSHFADRVVLGIDRLHGDQNERTVQPLPDLVDRFEASLIRDALRSNGGSVKHALEVLKIPRKTFYDKVNRHGIELDEFRD